MVDGGRTMEKRAEGDEREHGGGTSNGGGETCDMGVGPDDENQEESFQGVETWERVQWF